MSKKKFNGFYLFVVAFIIGMLYITFQYFRGSASANIGITQVRVFRITNEKPGIIKRIHVTPGQEVKKGELLVEMESSILEMEMIKLTTQIEALKKEREEKATLIESKIEYLRAEADINNKDIETEIQQIASELKLNKQLTEQFVNPQPAAEKESDESIKPSELYIGSLEDKKKLNNRAMKIQIEDLLKDHSSEMLVLANTISLRERELELLKQEKERLKKYATSDGIVEIVLAREGEEVQAYTPIISLNPKSPNAVTAYIVGPKGRELPVGKKVKVASYNQKNNFVEGEVIGSGSILPLPEILQKSTAVTSFGREVFIKIPAENNFAPGEKVMVR